MKIGEIIDYKGWRIKKSKVFKNRKANYYLPDTGLFFETLQKAKKFIAKTEKDEKEGKNITINFDKIIKL